MGVFDRFKKEKRADESPVVGKRESEGFLLRALLGKSYISKEDVLSIPSVEASINAIAGTISSLPLKLYKETNGKVEEIEDYRLNLLNKDTGDTLTSVQFWKAVVEDYFLGKGAYVYINKQRNKIKSLNYVDEMRVTINVNTDPIFKDYDIVVNGNTYKPHQFIKFLRKSKNGGKGISITDENVLIFAVTYNSLLYEDRLVRKGGNKRGFLKSPRKLSDASMKALKEAWKSFYNNNDENVIVLNDGLEFQEASNTSVEMQLNENKVTNSSEISMLFNIPNAIIRGNATEQDNKNYIKYGIIPILNDFECSLDRDLLLEKEKDQGYYFAFDTKELLRGSLKERYEAYGIAIDKNIMQVDEVRALEDLEPINFNYIKLGLADVLLNPRTKEIYTPNTDKHTNMEELSKGGEIEDEDRDKGQQSYS